MTDQVFINCQNIFRAVFHRKGQGIVYICSWIVFPRLESSVSCDNTCCALSTFFSSPRTFTFPFRAISVTCKALSIFFSYLSNWPNTFFSCSAGMSIMVSRIPINQFPSCCIFSASAFGSSCTVPFCTIPNGPDKTSFPFAEYRFVSLYILTSFSEI